ncbi:MAG: hypothetical protein IJ272_03990 [Clostridia bacterium]|nr:hypothetical protein [Clostridia bacterium]
MNTIPKANQIKIILTFVVVAIIITLIVVFREQLFKVKENITDSERFFRDYNGVTVDNVYKYVTAKEAIELFSSDEAVIFFGFKECIWCQEYAPILNDYAKENNVETIYYVDIKEDRANNTEAYQELVKLLDKYLAKDDNGNKRIYVPDVYFVNDGKIVGHNNDTSTQEGADTKEYYEQNGEALKEKINKLFSELGKACDDSGNGC